MLLWKFFEFKERNDPAKLHQRNQSKYSCKSRERVCPRWSDHSERGGTQNGAPALHPIDKFAYSNTKHMVLVSFLTVFFFFFFFVVFRISLGET